MKEFKDTDCTLASVISDQGGIGTDDREQPDLIREATHQNEIDCIVQAIAFSALANANTDDIGIMRPTDLMKKLDQLKTGLASDNTPLVGPEIYHKLKGVVYTSAITEAVTTTAYVGDW